MWDELGFRTDLEAVAPLNTLPWPTPTGGQRHRGPCTSRRGCCMVAAANHLLKSFYRGVNINNLATTHRGFQMDKEVSHSQGKAPPLPPGGMPIPILEAVGSSPGLWPGQRPQPRRRGH